MSTEDIDLAAAEHVLGHPHALERVVVVAYREDTRALEAAIAAEGFTDVVVQRPVYTEEEQTYSRDFRCFMNHRNAWLDAATRPGWTLVIEADFVRLQVRVPVPTIRDGVVVLVEEWK